MKRLIWLFMTLCPLSLMGMLGGCCTFANSNVDSALSPNPSRSALSTRVVSVRIVPGAVLPLPKEEITYSQGGAFVRSTNATHNREHSSNGALLELTAHQLEAEDGTIPDHGAIQVNDLQVMTYVVEDVSPESDHALIRVADLRADFPQAEATRVGSEDKNPIAVHDGMFAWLATPEGNFTGRLRWVERSGVTTAPGTPVLFFQPDSRSSIDRPGLSGFPIFVGEPGETHLHAQAECVGVNVGSADVDVTKAGRTYRERMKLVGR